MRNSVGSGLTTVDYVAIGIENFVEPDSGAAGFDDFAPTSENFEPENVESFVSGTDDSVDWLEKPQQFVAFVLEASVDLDLVEFVH